MKKLNLFYLFIFFALTPGISQSPYQLDLKKEVIIGTVAAGTGGVGYYLHKQLEPHSEMEILSLEQQELGSFRRWPTRQRSESADAASDLFLYSSQVVPMVMTLADKRMRKDIFPISALYSETLFINLGLTVLVKNAVRRTRPYVYNPEIPAMEKTERSSRTSFYSGHTSQTAAMCFLSARLYSDYRPDSSWKPVVWTAAATIPAVTGYLRMKAGRHFFTDVLTGYLMGAAVGFFIPKIHLRKQPEKVTLHF